MTLSELLDVLSARAVELFVAEGRLRYRAPAGALTPELKDALTARRDELVALLARPQPPDRTGPQPLSSAQMRMWFLDRLTPDDPSYNVAFALDLKGDLDAGALESSLQRMVERHAALRARFAEGPDGPVQVVMPPEPLGWERFDLTGLPAEQRRDAALRLAAEHARRPFDLSAGRLLRAALIELDRTHHVVAIASHHIAVDGWSVGVLVEEIAECYRARIERREPQLAALAISYVEYAAQEQEWLAGPRREEELAHWKRVLGERPPQRNLPADHRIAGQRSSRGATIHRVLPAALADSLRQLSRREGVTLYTTLLAGVQALLQRWCREDDVLVATAVSTRSRPEVANVVGCFANTVLLRTDLARAPSTHELLRRTRDTLADAFQHQELPFDAIVKALRPAGDDLAAPLYQVMFGFDNARDELVLPGLAVNLIEIDLGTARCELNVLAYERPEGLALAFEYSTDLFDPTTIERFAAQLVHLLARMVEDPDRPVCRLAVVAPEQRTWLLAAGNAARTEIPALSVLDLFEQVARRTPDAIAVRTSVDDLTYQQLDHWANRLAQTLIQRGAGPECCVPLVLPRTAQAAIAILAVWKAGACYLAIDPATPPARIQQMVDQVGARVVIATTTTAASLGDRASSCLVIDDLTHGPAVGTPRASDPRQAAYVVFTSGSTGTPKGVVVSHGALVNHAQAMVAQYALGSSDRVLQFASLGFDVSAEEMFPTWVAGATLVLRDEQAMESLAAFSRHVIAERLTVLNLPSQFWHAWVEELAREGSCVPPEVRCMIVGSERPSPEVCAVWRKLGGARIRWFNCYGPSEATITATSFELPAGAPDPVGEVPIGQPIANVRAYVLDPWLEPTPIGLPGELYLGGDGLARGYLAGPGATAERFVPDPYGPPGARLYRTGDLTRRRDDGALELAGRIDDQVKLRGFRIEPQEVEAVLARHPRVREAAVLAVALPAGDRHLVAWVVADAAASEGELREHLRHWLPDYMQPHAIVRLERLPRSANGKLDRRALPEPVLETEPRGAAPRSPLEQLVAASWVELLRVSSVGVDDNFFALGGHSLLATRLVSRLRSVLGIEVPLRMVFAYPTVASFARRVDELRREGGPLPPPLTRVERGEHSPLSFAQERLWFLARLQPNNPFYNMAAAARLDGVLDTAALERAFQTVAQRHETLRTTFVAVDGRPAQRIAPTADLHLPIRDLSALAAEERDAEAHRLAGEISREPFDLEHGPLVRLALLRLGAAQHVLLVSMHHIISDGWSVEVLLHELEQIYRAECTGSPANLPELQLQYVDFAAWQRRYLEGAALAHHIDYWRKQLAGCPPLLELPTDRPRPAEQAFRGARLTCDLDAELTAALRTLSQREGATLFMTLQAGWQAVMARYSGQDDFVIGSPVANRGRAELEPLIGVFFNTLALRADVSGSPTFRELLRRVRETALGAYEHQDLPFEKLVEELRPPRNLSYTPIFQVVLAFESAPAAMAELPGLTMRTEPLDLGAVRCDIMMFVEEHADRLACSMHYDTDLFDRSTMERLAEHFASLLAAAAADPSLRVDRLPMLTAAERALATAENRTHRPDHSGLRLHQLVEAQVDRTPDAVALVFADAAGARLTYRELDDRANQLARFLRRLEVGPESLVGVAADRSLDMVVALLAVLKAGAAYVPIDPSYPRERVELMLADSGAAVLLTQAHLASRLPTHSLRTVLLDEDWPSIATEPRERPDVQVSDDGLAYMIFTSGSTGRPKGAMNTHRAIRNRLLWMQDALRIDAHDCVLQKTPFSFDVSVWEFFWPLMVGARLAIAPPGQHQEPAALARTIAAQRVTTIHFVPSMLQLFLDEKDLTGCECLERVVCSGEALPAELAQRFFERLPAELHNLYGPTEAAVDVTWWPCERDSQRRSVPIGRPIANLQIHVLDPQLQPTPIGVAGELYIGGIGLARGYHARAGLTSEKFVADPYSEVPGARMYRTGDRVRRLVGGEIEYLGRFDHQVKIRGLRVELGEIEAALLRNPLLREAVVVARQPRSGDQRLVAYVVPFETAPSVHELRSYLGGVLPSYMIPAGFEFLPELPLGPSGKIDRRALPEPGGERPELERPYAEPSSLLEELLVAMWAEHLGVARVGIHDDFFELGGHSLLAAQVLANVQELLQIEVPLRSLFEAPTVVGLIAKIEALPGGADQVRALLETAAQIQAMSDEDAANMLSALQAEPKD